MGTKQNTRIIFNAVVAVILLLLFYFVIVTVVSGFPFAVSQFKSYWYFLVSLALGFGIQIGLYTNLKRLVENSSMKMGGKTVAVTGATSTLAMISCCAHYLANIVPILGIAGALTIVAQYQIEIFWVGLAFNIFGIVFISNKIIKFSAQGDARLPDGQGSAVSVKGGPASGGGGKKHL